jgi:hypothetical protein
MAGFFKLHETKERAHWERVRWSATVHINAQLPKGKSIEPKQLTLFPWERVAKKEQLSKAEAKAILNRWQKEDSAAR